MTLDFVDATGQPRPDDDIEMALAWVSKKIIRPDFKDPEGVICCVTIREALQELLQIRAAIRKVKTEEPPK
jgi:hypothetical protein